MLRQNGLAAKVGGGMGSKIFLLLLSPVCLVLWWDLSDILGSKGLVQVFRFRAFEAWRVDYVRQKVGYPGHGTDMSTVLLAQAGSSNVAGVGCNV